MSERLTLERPDELARRARALAAATRRPLEEAVLDWIGRAVAEPEVEALGDDALLALCEPMLGPETHDELGEACPTEPKRSASYRRRL